MANTSSAAALKGGDTSPPNNVGCGLQNRRPCDSDGTVGDESVVVGGVAKGSDGPDDRMYCGGENSHSCLSEVSAFALVD